MGQQFPTTVPTYPDTSGNEKLGEAGGGLGLSRILDDYGLDITANSTKIGTGSSTPSSGKVLRANGVGTSVWGAVDLTADVTGTLPTSKGGTGTTTLTFPGGTDTLVSRNSTDTLTNKTLSNPTLNIDTISEHTGGNGVSVDGLNIKDSKLNTTNSVVTDNITDDAVTDDKLDYPRFWQEIGRTTLGSAGDTITVNNLPARKYLKIIISLQPTGGTINTVVRYNNDSGSNYAQRGLDNATETTFTSQTGVTVSGTAAANPTRTVMEVENIATICKLASSVTINRGTAGAGNLPNNRTVYSKWENTANQISRIDVSNSGTGDFAIGSELIVLGHN